MATLSSRGGSLVVISVIVAQCFLYAIGASIPSDVEQSRQMDVLPSNSSGQPISSSDDSGLPVDVKSGFPNANFEPKREGDIHHPSGDIVFGRKKKPHVLKWSPPVNRQPYPSLEPAVSPTSFAYVPSSPKPPCFHHHVKIEPVEFPASISPLPFLSTGHQPYPRIEPVEVPASVQPVPHFYEPSHPPPSPSPSPSPKTEATEEPVSVGSPSPSATVDSSSSEPIPNDFNIGDIFAPTAAAESHLSTSDSAVTPVQETLITQGPAMLPEEKPHADQKPAVEPKPHRSVIASILHKKEHLKEKIHHKKEGENSTAAAHKPHNSIVSSILHKKEHLVENIHHKKDEEKHPAAAEPHRSIVSSLLHKKEHLKEKIHHERKHEDVSSSFHKENEVKEEKVPIAENANHEGPHNDGGSHHEFSLLHKKAVHIPAVSSLLHKIHHKREVKHHDEAVKPHGSTISSVLHKVEHLKEKIHHKKTEENAKPHRHSIVSTILHKKEHLKGAVHHEQEKDHSIIASILHKKEEAKEVKVPTIESPASEAHHHELPPALHKKPHESVVSSVLHKIQHKRESSSTHEEEEESLNFDVPHIGLPVPKASILHKLKSGKDHDHEHETHSLLKDLLHKV